MKGLLHNMFLFASFFVSSFTPENHVVTASLQLTNFSLLGDSVLHKWKLKHNLLLFSLSGVDEF